MKLDVGALLNSTFNTTTSNDTAWRAAMTLWCRAWHQVPGGSLPADDAALCHLAGLGRDVKTWKRIKTGALHGFALCDDGRLYHGFLCKMAMEAHEEMVRFETRRQRDRERKSAGVSCGIPSETAVDGGDLASGNPAEIAGPDLYPPKPPIGSPAAAESRRSELGRMRPWSGGTAYPAVPAARGYRRGGQGRTNPAARRRSCWSEARHGAGRQRSRRLQEMAQTRPERSAPGFLCVTAE